MIWRALRTTAPFGLAAGTLYFVVIGLTATIFSVLGAQTSTLMQLVLFIGVGAALGLFLGLVVGVSLGLTWREGRPPGRQRLVGAVAGGVPVLVVTSAEYLTGAVGVLDPELTTSVIVPTVVAALGSAAAATNLDESSRR